MDYKAMKQIKERNKRKSPRKEPPEAITKEETENLEYRSMVAPRFEED